MIWQHFIEEVSLLARRIEGRPVVLVGLVPGGMVMAPLLAAHLSIHELYGLTVSNPSSEPCLETEILGSLQDKNLLLICGCIAQGMDMALARDYLQSKGAQVTTACLYLLADAVFKPDIALRTLTSPIAFPWE